MTFSYETDIDLDNINNEPFFSLLEYTPPESVTMHDIVTTTAITATVTVAAPAPTVTVGKFESFWFLDKRHFRKSARNNRVLH